jgi:hypothetical protein
VALEEELALATSLGSTLKTPAPSFFSTGAAGTADGRGCSGIPLGLEMDRDGG